MKKEAKKRIAAELAKSMATLCVRNTHLETIRAGKTPVSRAGNWSDLTVVDTYGNRILHRNVSYIIDDLMRDIVNRRSMFILCADEPGLQAEVEWWMMATAKRSEPELKHKMKGYSANWR